MPISVIDLKPGDRVMLNCPKSRGGRPKREARFDGIFASISDAMQENCDAFLVAPPTIDFLSRGKAWARFTTQTVSGPAAVLEYPGGGAIKGLPEFAGETQLAVVFVIEPDGGLREEEGRRVYIERRMAMGQG